MNENQSENLPELEKRYRTTVFIILGQVFVVLLLIAAAFLFTFKVETNLSEQDFTTLWVGVLFIAVGSFILRRMFFTWERLKNVAILKGVPGVLGTLQRNSIILSVFGLLVGVIGFLISLFTGSGFDMLRAGAIALVVFLINFPRKKIWKSIVSNLEEV
jgi:hypothetical protein